MNSSLPRDLHQHFDDLADQADTASPSLTHNARVAGENERRQRAIVGAGLGTAVLVLCVGFGVTAPWGTNSSTQTASGQRDPSPSQPPASASNETHLPGASWKLLRGAPGGAEEVERYGNLRSLLDAAPLLVRGVVEDVTLRPLVFDPQADQPYRDILLSITPIATAGPDARVLDTVVVQLGPFFGSEASDWVTQMSAGSSSLIGDEAIWALRPRQDSSIAYRPLTSGSVFVRTGEAVLNPLGDQGAISHELADTSWSQLLQMTELEP